MSADEEATAVAALVAVLVHADEMADQSRPSDGDATAAEGGLGVDVSWTGRYPTPAQDQR